MLKPKKKMGKHDLKEDKFVKFTLQAKTYFDENSKRITMYVFGVFAVIAVIIIYSYIGRQSRFAASGQLGIAQIEYNNGNYDTAAQRLHRLIDDYGGSDAALQGIFLLANIYYQQKEYADAHHYFEQFIDEYSGSNILLASGYSGLASCYEIENDYAQAAQLYVKAANIATDLPESDDYRYLAGICFKKAGDIENAITQFEKLVDQSKPSSRANDAESQLVMLNRTQSKLD